MNIMAAGCFWQYPMIRFAYTGLSVRLPIFNDLTLTYRIIKATLWLAYCKYQREYFLNSAIWVACGEKTLDKHFLFPRPSLCLLDLL